VTGRELRAQVPDDDREVFIEGPPRAYYPVGSVALGHRQDASGVVLVSRGPIPEAGTRERPWLLVDQSPRRDYLEDLWRAVKSGDVNGMAAAIARLNSLEQP